MTSSGAGTARSLRDVVDGLPKAELHVHLEGTLEPATALTCARRNGITVPWSSPEQLQQAYAFDGLPGFLEVLFGVARTLRRRQDFHDLAMGYLSRAVDDGVRRAEMFFGTQTFLDVGVPIGEMIEGVLGALREAEQQWGIQTALIPTAQRHRSQADALELLERLDPWREQLIGVGLGSAERGNPPGKFADYFDAARRRGYRVSVHAGEDAPPSYVREALDVVRPDRIDHGVSAAEDPSLVTRLREEGIPLTMCPLSNLALHVVPSLDHHPLAGLLREGVTVTVNSDDPPFFGGYLTENYVAAAEALALSPDEVVTLARNSITASWADDAQRGALIHELDAVTQRRS